MSMARMIYILTIIILSTAIALSCSGDKAGTCVSSGGIVDSCKPNFTRGECEEWNDESVNGAKLVIQHDIVRFPRIHGQMQRGRHPCAHGQRLLTESRAGSGVEGQAAGSRAKIWVDEATKRKSVLATGAVTNGAGSWATT